MHAKEHGWPEGGRVRGVPRSGVGRALPPGGVPGKAFVLPVVMPEKSHIGFNQKPYSSLYCGLTDK